MDTSTQPTSNPSGPPPSGVPGTTLILSVAVGVCATAAIILGVLYFRPATPGSGGGGEALLEQHGTVSPQSKFTGTVYYPSPYGLPPQLAGVTAALSSPLQTQSSPQNAKIR